MLSEDDLAPTWIEQFDRWMDDALRAGIAEPYGMVVSTASPGGRPSSRSVLLRGVSKAGFVFHTNYHSRKGGELAANPAVSLLMPWYDLGRQVVVDGRAERLSSQESDAYWAARPQASRLSALASPQSQVIGSREELEVRRATLVDRYGEGPVPRPSHWGGFRVAPTSVEFWQAGADRMHDRLRYRLEGGAWVVERLAP
ncbi:MAG: pyridoxamine 5'-phosphate oxidase [Actinomycetota bacterium]